MRRCFCGKLTLPDDKLLDDAQNQKLYKTKDYVGLYALSRRDEVASSDAEEAEGTIAETFLDC